MITKALIIPAAGSGSRLGTDIPKPFLELCDRTILEWTLQPFVEVEGLQKIVVPTSPEYVQQVERILRASIPDTIEVQAISGGKERQHSIAKALDHVGNVHLVMVHDAVRPFVTLSQIKSCCKKAEEQGAAILGVPTKNTIKKINEQQEVLETPSRSSLWEAQTPQVFKTKLLKKAYRDAMTDKFLGTDDASLVERMGHEVFIVKGSQSNFKITYPLDLKVARQLIKAKTNE